MKCAVLPLLLTGSAVLAQTSNWMEIATSSTGTVWSIRASDLLNSSNQNPHVWFELDHSNDKKYKEKKSKAFIAFRCREATYQQLNDISYAADGSVIDSQSHMENPYSYRPAPPDSVIEAALKAACPSE